MAGQETAPRVLGIVAEYDPFHRGHAYHLREAQRLVRPDWTLVVLSGCFTQRGALSLLDPFDRASLALQSGADAVFELPARWSVRDAEHYALGAISLLTSLGCTHLAFGAECPDLPRLQQLAERLEAPDAALKDVLREGLAQGLSYPAALTACVSPEDAALIQSPNNLLALSYLRAIRCLRVPLIPVLIPRGGSYHAAIIDPETPSASSLREGIARGDMASVYAAVPEPTAALLRARRLENALPDARLLDAAALHHLRSLSAAALSALPMGSEGLDHALGQTARQATEMEELVARLTSRRYPAARIRRLCAHALLGITDEELKSASLPTSAALLALRRLPAMTASWRNAPLPILSSPTAWRDQPEYAANLRGYSLRALCCRCPDTLPFSRKVETLDPSSPTA